MSIAPSMRKPKIIAITGGIGSGKSVVSRIVSLLGFKVYDCDSRAKALVDRNRNLIERIASEVCHEALNEDYTLNRRVLAACVFSDQEALNRLNTLVHSSVRDDIAHWAEMSCESVLFVETAILYQSRLHLMVDEVWDVQAPDEVRVTRVMARNGISAEEVRLRIESQNFNPGDQRHESVTVILNDGIHALLPQVLSALSRL